jgi:menaquinone-dependent protoporphyrinogen oxidase
MSGSILVTYATRYGSTEQVAEAVAATLREGGLDTDLVPMRQVRSLEGYRAVVLGAPLYIGSWHKDARRFLVEHREALGQKPVAVFALGPTTNPRDETEWQSCRGMLDKELAKASWLAPAAVELFGGKYDPARLRLADRLIAGLPASPLHNVPASDVRDWAAIRAWSNGLPARLGGRR